MMLAKWDEYHDAYLVAASVKDHAKVFEITKGIDAAMKAFSHLDTSAQIRFLAQHRFIANVSLRERLGPERRQENMRILKIKLFEKSGVLPVSPPYSVE